MIQRALQAEKELPKGWTLMRAGTPTCPEIPDWLASNLPQGSVVGIDPLLHTVSSVLSSELPPNQISEGFRATALLQFCKETV